MGTERDDRESRGAWGGSQESGTAEVCAGAARRESWA